MPAPKKYDEESQTRAVRIYADRMAEGGISQLKARQEVGELLGINPATLRNWIRREMGEAQSPPREESLEAENVRLRKENARLQRANEMLKAASAFSPRRCPVTGLLEAFIPRKDESHGSTEEVPGRVA